MAKRNKPRPGGRTTSSGSTNRRSSSPRKRTGDSADQKRSKPPRSGGARSSKPWAKRDDERSEKKSGFSREEGSKFTRTSSPRSSRPDTRDSGKGDGEKKFTRSSSRDDRASKSPARASRSFGTRSDNRDERKPRYGKSEGDGFKRSSSRDRDSGTRPSKPFSKRDDERRENKRRFGKNDDAGSKKTSSRSYGERGERSSRSSKPFTKRDDNNDDVKPRFGKSRDEKGFSKSSGSFRDRDDRTSSRPRKSFGKRDDESTDRKSSFRKEGYDSSKPTSPKSKFGSDDSDFRKGKSKAFKAAPADYEAKAPVQTGQMRLNRYIANSGICSRREADELIKMGLIAVNGKVVTELGFKVNPSDEVRHENRVLRAEKLVYILMNKPKGYLTTTVDPQERNTVMHIIGNSIRERIYPVGRLDRNTTGLLLLTNDGELADKLMHPSYNVKKIYKVDLDRPLTKGDFQKLQEGVQLEEGRAQLDDVAIVSEDGKTVGVELHIGWNRVVRRIFESLGYEVEKLDRSVYAGLDKKDLPRGHWRHLRKDEIIRLKHFK